MIFDFFKSHKIVTICTGYNKLIQSFQANFEKNNTRKKRRSLVEKTLTKYISKYVIV